MGDMFVKVLFLIGRSNFHINPDINSIVVGDHYHEVRNQVLTDHLTCIITVLFIRDVGFVN